MSSFNIYFQISIKDHNLFFILCLVKRDKYVHFYGEEIGNVKCIWRQALL